MRSYEESCEYLDLIVGRCVREAVFAEAVLRDPESALAEYELTDDEMDDFRALQKRHCEEARKGWSALRASLARSSKLLPK
jgi:hypothetical protein